MGMTVCDRLNAVLKSKRYTINALSKEINIKTRTLNNQLSGTTALTADTVCAIAEMFPDVSAEWLLRGIGGMLRVNEPHVLQVNDAGDNIQGSIINSQLIEMLQEKDRQIAKLIDIIERK